MLIYILKFSACLALFMLFYRLFLEKLSIHIFKRFYLLGSLGLAFWIPSLTFVVYIEPMVSGINLFEPTEPLTLTASFEQLTHVDYTSIVLWSIYGLGVVVFLLKFCFNLYQITSRIRNNPKYKSESYTNVLVTHLMIPHTFFRYIFLNKVKFENNDIPQEVLLHEQAHANQKHSIDVLILELLQIVFWFHPLVYFLKQDIKLNHEFLADQAVLQKGTKPAAYQNIILAFSSKATNQPLANAINYSSIKKRFTVMKTHSSKQSIRLRSLLLLPLLAILVYSFTERQQVVKNSNLHLELQSQKSEGVSETLMQEYTEAISEFKRTQRIEASTLERLVTIYNLMSKDQQKSVEKYPSVPNIDLSTVASKQPNPSQFESWKDAKTFAIWLDGKHIPNKQLEQMSVDDIAYYTGSSVYKNARSDKFPQPYQFYLYTKQGFNKTYQLSKIDKYKDLTLKYSLAIQHYLKGEQSDNSELKILKERCDRIYNSFSKEDIKTHKILSAPPVPMMKLSQQGATKSQLDEYNRLAKRCNLQIEKKGFITHNDVLRIKELYGFMSNDQKKIAEPFPDFSKLPPPPPPPPLLKGEVSENLINTYNDWVNSLKNPDGTYNDITDEDYNYFISVYNTMTDEQKKKASTFPPPPPPKVPATPKKGNSSNAEIQNDVIKTGFIQINGKPHYYTTINGTTKYYDRYGFEVTKTGEKISPSQVNASDVIPNQYIKKVYSNDEVVVEFKDNKPSKNGDLNIPPPPPPVSPIDHIVAMAKKEAKFFYEGQPISSDRAIQLVKTNKKLNIFTKNESEAIPQVFITKSTKGPKN